MSILWERKTSRVNMYLFEVGGAKLRRAEIGLFPDAQGWAHILPQACSVVPNRAHLYNVSTSVEKVTQLPQSSEPHRLPV